MKELTIEMLSKKYSVLILKHSFPVSNIMPDRGLADFGSNLKTCQNYKLQWNTLERKAPYLLGNKVQSIYRCSSNYRCQNRVRGCTIYRVLSLGGTGIGPGGWQYISVGPISPTDWGRLVLDDFALSPTDSHPNEQFAGKASNLLFNRIIDIIEFNGKITDLWGNRLVLSTDLHLEISVKI